MMTILALLTLGPVAATDILLHGQVKPGHQHDHTMNCQWKMLYIVWWRSKDDDFPGSPSTDCACAGLKGSNPCSKARIKAEDPVLVARNLSLDIILRFPWFYNPLKSSGHGRNSAWSSYEFKVESARVKPWLGPQALNGAREELPSPISAHTWKASFDKGIRFKLLRYIRST